MTACGRIMMTALVALTAACSGTDGKNGAPGQAGPLPTMAVGGGLTGTGDAASPLAVNFGSSGSATTVARSDHAHAEIATLQTTIASHATDLASLQTTTTSYAADLASLQTTVASHTTEIASASSGVADLTARVGTLEGRVPSVPGSVTVEMPVFANTWNSYVGGDIVLTGWDGTHKVTLTTGNWLLFGSAQVTTRDVSDTVSLGFRDVTTSVDFGKASGEGTEVNQFRSLSTVGFYLVGATPVDVTLAVRRNGSSSLSVSGNAAFPGAVLRAIRLN